MKLNIETKEKIQAEYDVWQAFSTQKPIVVFRMAKRKLQ